jgi:hypothetical protein
MRTIGTAAALLGAVALAACGGGGGGSPGALVLGSVVERDGSSDDLGGIVVECPESGDVVSTREDGSFEVDVPAGASFEVKFDDPGATKDGEGADCPESDDPEKDGRDIEGDGVAFDPLPDGGSCEIEVSIEDGEVVECRESRDGEDGKEDEHEGEARLFPSARYAEQGVVGEIEVGKDDGCFFAEIEASGFDAPHVLRVMLGVEGALVEIGVLEISVEGEGHLGLEWCSGDPLPFDVETLRTLSGALVLVLDEEGNEVFEGHLPGFGVADPKHDGKDGDDDEEGDDGKDDGDEESNEEDGDEGDGKDGEEGEGVKDPV